MDKNRFGAVCHFFDLKKAVLFKPLFEKPLLFSKFAQNKPNFVKIRQIFADLS